jgi:hypothetical protein
MTSIIQKEIEQTMCVSLRKAGHKLIKKNLCPERRQFST